MPKRTRRLDLRWSPKRLKQFCETHAAWVLELGPRMTSTGIERLYWRHVRSADGHPEIIEEIAADLRTPRRVLRDIWTRVRSHQLELRKYARQAMKAQFGAKRRATKRRRTASTSGR
jgi:hypothetical protein